MVGEVILGNTIIGLVVYSVDLTLLENNLKTVKQHFKKLIYVAGHSEDQ